MMQSSVRWLLIVLMLGLATTSPVSYHDIDSHPLADLGQRLASRSSLLEPRQDPRLPIPTPQDIDAIKKVAQILVMLGQQLDDPNKKKSGHTSRIELLNSIVDTLRSLSLNSARLQKKYVIPAILGDSGSPHSSSSPAEEDIPNDPVEV